MQGTVAWFSSQKGYGFISPKDGGVDVFVYHQAIQMDGYRTLVQGETVSYELGEKDGKPMAINVRRKEAANGR